MARIAVDIQLARTQKTGIGFYVDCLMRALPQSASHHEYLLLEPRRDPSGHNPRDLSAPQRLLWEQYELPARARHLGAQLIHPAFSATRFPRGAKTVVTAHDIIALLMPHDFSYWSRQFFGRWVPLSYRWADHILADSEATKHDLIRHLGIPAEKITTVYLAADERYRPIKNRTLIERVKKQFNIPGEYLLHIGTLSPRKNLDLLIEIFPKIAANHQELSLVLAGHKNWYYETLRKKARDMGVEQRVIFTGYLAEEDKPALLAGALVAPFPSLYEGFGLPPLEAMAMGIPVVASNASSIPEVVGKAGILVDPTDPAAWYQAIDRVVRDKQLRTRLTKLGDQRAKEFTWQKTAQQTVAVYDRVLRANE